jgi:DNA repair photolyase
MLRGMAASSVPPLEPPRGRGAAENPANRFDRLHIERTEADLDNAAWAAAGADGEEGFEDEARVPTEYYRDTSRSIIAHNDSPDVGFTASINPYRGCEHGCIYCYARPYHDYLGLSSGLDFETRIFVKTDAAALLRAELMKPSWQPTGLALSGITDPYQPGERIFEVTRGCLQVLAEFRQPVGIISKNALMLRDIDVLQELARYNAVHVSISITSLDEHLRRVMEPRTVTAERRLDAVARLNQAGIPAGVMIAPIIPGLTDHEIPRLLERAGQAGAVTAGYTMLRLPHAVAPLFEAWLGRNFPDRKDKVLARIRDVRGGQINDYQFGSRMRGTGPFAELIGDVFRKAKERAGIPAHGDSMSTASFRRPTKQPSLFDM